MINHNYNIITISKIRRNLTIIHIDGKKFMQVSFKAYITLSFISIKILMILVLFIIDIFVLNRVIYVVFTIIIIGRSVFKSKGIKLISLD